MGYAFNNNQPVVFNYDNGFCGTVQREYCILKNSTDRISTQFRLAASTTNLLQNSTFTPGAELMTNHEFTGSATGWTLSNWVYNSNDVITVVGTAGTVQQAVTGIQAGKTYYVEIEFTPTALGGGASFTFGIGGVTAATDLASYATGSTYYAKGYFTATGTGGVVFTNNTTWRGRISKVSVKQVGWATGTNDFDIVDTSDSAGSWVVATSACHTQGNIIALFPQNSDYTYTLTVGRTYKIVSEVSSITEGEVNIYFGATLVGTIEANGSYIFTATCTNAVFDSLYLVPTSNFDGCIDNMYLYAIPDEFQACIKDTDGNFEMAIPSSEITQDGEWVYIETTAAELGLTSGCYTICLTETALTDVRTEYITNGDFSNGASDWTYTAGWTFDSIKASAASTDSTDIETLTQSFSIENCDLNRTLTLTFDLIIDTDSQLTVTAQGVNSGTPFGTQTFGSNGSKTLSIIPTDDTAVELSFDFRCVNPAVNKTMQLDNVSLFSSGCDLTYPYTSNCINVADSHDCTKEFEWYNTKNSFGFNYVDFTTRFNLRIHCEFGKWKHLQNFNIWENYNLNSSVVAGNSKEIIEVKTEMLPENVHRALAIARMHDNLYIDNVETNAVAGDYEPEWTEKNKNFAIVRFDIWQQGLRTNACGVDIVTPADEELLLDPTTEDCILSLE
jgi:hypothetical protein